MSNKIATLPQFQSDDRDFQLMQSQWATSINPLLRNPLVNGVLLENVPLVMGDNVINTLLSRKQRGWFMVDQTAAADIYRSGPFNAQTLTLNASAPCTVSLWMF